MAVISHFEVAEAKGRLQPTHVAARVKIIRPDEAPPIVQIDTVGSSERDNPGKLSQTIQLTRDRAIELHGLLARIYGL